MTEREYSWAHWAVLNALDYCVAEGKIPFPLEEAIVQGQGAFMQAPMAPEKRGFLLTECNRIAGLRPDERLYPAGFRTLAEAIREDYRKSMGMDKSPQGGSNYGR